MLEFGKREAGGQGSRRPVLRPVVMVPDGQEALFCLPGQQDVRAGPGARQPRCREGLRQGQRHPEPASAGLPAGRKARAELYGRIWCHRTTLWKTTGKGRILNSIYFPQHYLFLMDDFRFLLILISHCSINS